MVARADWAELVSEFRDFFAPLGRVNVSDEEVEFQAGYTGLALHRDGTSRSFMPLHDLSATWEQVSFDRANLVVQLMSEQLTYTYRVPSGRG